MIISRLVPLLALVCLSLCVHGTAFLFPKLQRTNSLQQNERQCLASCERLPPGRIVGTRGPRNPLVSSSRSRNRSSTCLCSVKSRIVQASSSFTALFLREFKELTRFQKGLLAIVFFIGYRMGKTKPFWKRYTSIMDIPANMFGSDAKVLRGRAVSVSDGDTIRFLHIPTWFSPTSIRKGEKTSETALPIRICTIDTPETAKFGKPGQPFGPEAKANLKSLLENKRVSVRLLQKDQYSRGVGSVYTGRLFFKTYADEQMLQDGLAEVYTGGGAVYGPKGKDEYIAMQDAAKQEKIGIWSQKNRESAADYKKRTK